MSSQDKAQYLFGINGGKGAAEEKFKALEAGGVVRSPAAYSGDKMLEVM